MSTTKIVKCVNCNVVISELLTFIQNKIEVMDEVSIQQVCTTSFSAEEISEAKVLLFDSIPTSARKVNRKGSGKSQRDIEDIICLFKESEPDVVPIFVARNLNKLPPVTFDYVDASKLLKDILLIREDITKLQNSCATVDQMMQIKNDLENLKSASLVNNFDYVNRKRGACQLNDSFCDSGPMGILPQTHDDLFQHESSFTAPGDKASELPLKVLPSYAQSVKSAAKTMETATGRSNCCDVPVVMTSRTPVSTVGIDAQLTDTMHCSSLSVAGECAKGRVTLENKNIVLSCNKQQQNVNIHERKENDWQVKEKKKKKNRKYINKTGCANNVQNFKASESKVPVFITNVHRDTKEQDITNYIKEKTGEQVSLIKLSQRIERGYNAFKLFVPLYKLNLFLEEKLWPKGILFRRFIHYNADRGQNAVTKKQ